MNTYPGGKAASGVYQQIINQIPPHQVYIEPFLGGGAILRIKRPAPIANIGIDIDALPIADFSDRIPNLQLIRANAIEWLSCQAYQPGTFIYLDPPYLLETRRQQRRIYRYELEASDHIAILDVITRLSGYCSIAISGYASSMYQEALYNWRMITFPAMTRGGKQATECLWMNYQEPLELHDYRFLGCNFRERERIKRKQNRWLNRLQTMPAGERYAMLSVIEQLRAADHARLSDVDIAKTNDVITRAPTPINDDAGSQWCSNAANGDAHRQISLGLAMVASIATNDVEIPPR